MIRFDSISTPHYGGNINCQNEENNHVQVGLFIPAINIEQDINNKYSKNINKNLIDSNDQSFEAIFAFK